MKITFLLPFASDHPIGGFKVVYEYCNRFASRGHDVTIIYPSYTFKENFINNSKYAIRYLQRKIDKSYRPSWFELDPAVRTAWIRRISDEHLPDSDVLIATAWRTAKCMENISESKGRKFYFIQHLETWNGPEKEVMDTWKLPFRKIVISKWLKDIAEELGEDAEYVPNGLSFDEFGIDIEPSQRDPQKVLMLYSELAFKGSQDGIDALNIIRKNGGNVKAAMFGTCAKPALLDETIEYHRSPDRKLLRRLYNEAAIFASTSHTEGFGLTGAESLMCGCSLVASDNGGHREFAIEGKTALLYNPGDSSALAERIIFLMNNTEQRLSLSLEGNKFIGGFTWEKSVAIFEKSLMI